MTRCSETGVAYNLALASENVAVRLKFRKKFECVPVIDSAGWPLVPGLGRPVIPAAGFGNGPSFLHNRS